VAVRLRPLLLAAALGAVAAIGMALPASAQDVTSTTVVSFGGAGAEPVTTTTAAPVTTAGAEGSEPVTEQEVTEGTSTESSLFTESRKVLATIGGLLICALSLTLLTIRYYRATKPLPVADPSDPVPLRPGAPVTGTAAALAAAEAVPASTAPASTVGADHARADSDYEPQGTGEHARVELPAPASASRPGRAARSAALGRSAPA